MSQSIAMPATAADATFRARRKRAIFSAWAGFGMDSFSIYIATSTLLPALIYFQGNMTVEQKGIFAGMTLAATLLGRPLGALLFGHFADVLGRRNVGAITIAGFGTMSLLIAFIPGAEVVGATVSTGLLIGIRFIEGIFLGGEYTAATPMALEYASPRHRGAIGGMIQCAASFGVFVVAILNTLVLLIAVAGDVHSPYVQWGWRIPFVLGFFLSIGIAWFLRRNVEDSTIWKSETNRTTTPLKDMLKGDSGKAFIQSWVIMTGVFFFSAIGSSVLIQFLLNNNPGYTPTDLAHTQLVTQLPSMCSYVLFGWLSDNIGRKPALYLAGIVAGVGAPITMTLVGLGHVQGWGNLTLLATLTQFFFVAPLGILPAYINERFATSVRSSGWGVAYSTAVIIPSFFPYYMVWLGHIIPFVYTGGALMAFGGVLIIVATAFGPETRAIDLNTVGAREEKLLGALPSAGGLRGATS